MTKTLEKPKVNKGDNDNEDRLEHICSATDVDISLCGKDISNEPWNHGGPACEACVYIAQFGPGSMN